MTYSYLHCQGFWRPGSYMSSAGLSRFQSATEHRLYGNDNNKNTWRNAMGTKLWTRTGNKICEISIHSVLTWFRRPTEPIRNLHKYSEVIKTSIGTWPWSGTAGDTDCMSRFITPYPYAYYHATHDATDDRRWGSLYRSLQAAPPFFLPTRPEHQRGTADGIICTAAYPKNSP